MKGFDIPNTNTFANMTDIASDGTSLWVTTTCSHGFADAILFYHITYVNNVVQG